MMSARDVPTRGRADTSILETDDVPDGEWGRVEFGSDAIALMLSGLGIDFVALNPGATLSGIHQSLVSGFGPQMILALNENTALSIADGYARAAGRPMAIALHDLVGLQSGSMGIFNAWMNRSAAIVLGGSGPRDVAKRRPWLDWAHSSREQADIVRDVVKWHDEPASIEASLESLAYANRIVNTAPQGPAYVAIDVALQDAGWSVGACREIPEFAEPVPAFAMPMEVAQLIADHVREAEFPVITADFTGMSAAAFHDLIQFAELVQCPVVDLGARHSFPNGHPLDASDVASALLGLSDLILALDPRDPMMGMVSTAHRRTAESGFALRTRPGVKLIDIGMHQLRSGGSVEPASFMASRLSCVADTSVCLAQLIDVMAALPRIDRSAQVGRLEMLRRDRAAAIERDLDSQRERMTAATVCRESSLAVRDASFTVANGEVRGWMRRTWSLPQFNDYLGRNVGAGLGYGVGASIGAALAFRGTDRCVINIQSDGDLLSTASSLWTLAKYKLPVLTVVLNNHSYGQDRMHQVHAHAERGRDASDVGIGVDIDDPEVDIAKIADAQGVESWGGVDCVSELKACLKAAVDAVANERRPALVDVSVER